MKHLKTMFFKSRKDFGFYACMGAFIFWPLLWILWLSWQSNSNISQIHRTQCTVYSSQEQLYSKQHEVARRHIDNQIWNLYYHIQSYVERNINNAAFVRDFGAQAVDETLSLLADFENFGSSVDNAAQWHKEELQKMTDFIQERIYNHQHPESCKNSKFLLCELNSLCGLGCIVHRVGYCLRIAAASNRVMLIKPDQKNWGYSKEGWTVIFKAVSNCSFSDVAEEAKKRPKWISVNQTERVLMLHHGWPSPIPQLGLSFPKQIADTLLTHHSNPPLFFGAQFYSYLTRSNSHLEDLVNKVSAGIKLDQSPIVGMHIRRTDKKLEAQFYSVDDYFKWAELWFKIQEKRNPSGGELKRRVYIATDEPKVIQEAMKKYPHYEIHANSKYAQSAQLKSRYTDTSLFGIAVDFHILSKCNYVVCTLSSNVCRLVYEMMQVEKGDAAHLLHSLDRTYFNHAQQAQYLVVTEDHNTKNGAEHNLKIGDKIRTDAGRSNLWMGLSQGIFNNKGKRYPSYKVKEEWRIIDFPLFERN